MQISQANAQAIANKMTEAKNKVAANLRKSFAEAVKEAYLLQVPDAVKKIFQSHPAFVMSTTQIHLDGHGFNREYVGIEGQVPAGARYETKLELNAKLADKLKKLFNAWQNEKEAAAKLNKEIYSALLALRTYKAVRENLPEAIPFLPERETMAISIDVVSLRKKLKAAA